MNKLSTLVCAAFVALGSFSVFGTVVDPEKFAAKVTFTAAGYSGSETLANFPMLVKLSESIGGFKYSDCPQASIRFADADGNLIPHEVDVWDASGTSFVWVSVPALSGNTTAVKMYYGGEGADEPASSDNVWTLANFKSVWHLNIADGATSDSVASYAGALLNPNEYCGAGTGIVGGDYLNVENLVNHSIKVTNMSAFTANPAGVVTYSAWVRQVGGSSISTKPDPENYPQIQWGSWGNCGAIWNSKNAQTSGNQGIELCLEGGKTNPQQFQRMVLRDSATTTANLNSALPNGLYDKQWHYVVVRYNGTNRQLIIDGVAQSNFSAAGTVTTPTGTVRMGGRVDTNSDCVWTGDLDEMRYRQGCTSDDWLVAETANVGSYDTFLTAVQEPIDETAIKFESAPTVVKSANGFTVSAKVISGAGALSVIYGTAYPFANTNQVEASVVVGTTYQYEITGLAADASYGFGVVGVSTGETVTEELGTQAFITGDITVVKGADADESLMSTPGYFTLSRPQTAVSGDVVVNYELGGTAVAGTHYVALPGSVTIPDGESSVTVDVYPLASHTGDHTLTLTVTNGLYNVGASGTATLTIKAFIAESGFAKKIVFTPSGYAGSETLTDFPMLVRLSTAIEGFNYADFELPNGGDIRFATEDGAPLAHEIDTWNTDGESLVWVKVPSFTKDTKIIAYYGNSDPWAVTTADVWADNYLGVWHFNEIADGTTPDSSGNNLGMVAKTASVQVAADGGQIGKSIVNCTASGSTNGGFLSPTYTDKFTSSKFSLSAWFNRNGKGSNGYERYFSSKAAHGDANGFEMECSNGSKTTCTARGSAADSVTVVTPDQQKAGWNKYTLVYDGAQLTVYTNGVVSVANKTVTSVAHLRGFAVGNNAARNERALLGNIDEVRFAKSCESADWVKAEYDTETKADFVTAENGVEPVDATAVKFAAKPTITKSGSVFSVNVSTSVDSGDGSITAYYGTDGEYDLSDVVTSSATASGDYSTTLTHLEADKSYKVSVWGENAKGTITKSKGEETLFNGELSAVKTRDADEASLANPGLFTVTRADSYGDLVVNYTTGGDAVAGTDYEPLSGTVTITNGAISAVIEVHPIRTQTVDHTLTITITDGLYLLGSPAPTASMTIKTLTTPTGYNTWIAEADGNASVAANWSENRVPISSDNILVDGRFSNASMSWDAGVNGLPATVASWTQTYESGDTEYSGTVTFKTVYPGKGDFTCFTVTGACVIDCGTWTHPQSRTNGDIHDVQWDWLADLKANETYRLRLACGSLTVGAKGVLDVKLKGYNASHNDARCNAAHGGATRSAAKTYGDPKEPIHIGLPHRTNGGYYNGKGGGAIYVTVTGDAVVNGAISADSGNTGFGAGAAGSVYLKAHAVTGTGSITARGSATGEGNYKGTGGRVAIITETAVNRATFTAISAEAEWKNAQGGQASEYGGCGTVFFKDSTMTNGKLVIAPKSDLVLNWANCYRMPVVSTDGDWTFDSIEFGRNGLLIIPAGTTLHLPGGLASCSGTAASSSVAGGLYYDGGTLDLGSAANLTMTGNWMIFANSNLTINANVTVTGGAVIGVPEYGAIMEESATLVSFPACKVTVNGNLTIDSTGKLKAEKCGFRKSWNSTEKGLTGYDTHGGRTLAFGKTLKLHYQGYDSIFNPWLPGCTVPQTNGQGVGFTASVLDITVTGTLTVNGPISATAIYEGAATHNSGAGPGGSIKITAGTLAGSADISADGACNSGSACGGGGRIAVRLTNPGATFAGFSGSIIASGRLSSAAALNNSSSAGTVYLQTASEGEKLGTIRIANRMVDKYYHAANSNTTEMASLGYGGDDVADYKGASYVVADYGRAAVNTNMTVKSLTLADVNSHLDLEGNTLTLSKFTYVTASATNKLAMGTYSLNPGAGEKAFPAGCNVYDSVGAGLVIVRSNGMKLVLR